VTPLDDVEFAAQMARLGPFEKVPHLAAAVSGGADSMALCLLAANWVRERGGTLVALTVDHGLRASSTSEARWVCKKLDEQGIPCQILAWQHGKPTSGIQQKARDARYRLLLEACREKHINYLLLGHHADDQAETVLMRLYRDTGLDGLAAMRPIVFTPFILLLRPLLHIEAERLVATLRCRQQEWLEDPSNRDSRFLRTTLRSVLPVCVNFGISRSDFNACSEKAAKAQHALVQAVSALLSRCCRLYTSGMVVITPTLFSNASVEIGWRALGRIVSCVGGAEWPASPSSLRRRFQAMSLPACQPLGTLGRCRFIWRSIGLVVCREKRNLPTSQTLHVGQSLYWDDRFCIRIPAEFTLSVGRLRVEPLSSPMWKEILTLRPEQARKNIPAAVRHSLPAIIDDEGVLAAPNLGFFRYERNDSKSLRTWSVFRPRRTLTGTSSFLEIAR